MSKVYFIISRTLLLAWSRKIYYSCGTVQECRVQEKKMGPFALAARSKAWVCGLSLAWIVGSNPAGGMDVCLL